MPKLMIENGPDKGRTYRISGTGTLLLGRDTTTHIRIPDASVSRLHFKIILRNGAYLVQDLGSANGTWVNEDRVENESPIRFGDKIRAGETILCFLDDHQFPKTDALIGQVVNGYRIEAMIGRGGMGTVYRATQLSLNRVVAFKVLSEELTRDPALIRRFLDEARAAGALNHHNIVQVHDAGQSGTVYYMSMEYAQGGSLQAILLTGNRPTPEGAVAIVEAVAKGLDYAEKKGIVHRDIKPDNLMVGEDNVVKIGDLGISKTLRQPESSAASQGLGSPHYIAPEQARGESVDIRADIYSLGITFYYLLSGQLPFEGTSAQEIIAKHCTEAPPPLRNLVPNLPALYFRVVEKMIAKRPEDRYANPAALLGDLGKLKKPKIDDEDRDLAKLLLKQKWEKRLGR
ncbi:MAG: FHA domain-containing serine/threonine-protein kinase [Planctomycetota bacterium]